MDKYEEMARRYMTECSKQVQACADMGSLKNEESFRTSIRFAVENALHFADTEREKETCEWGEVMDAVPTCINPTGKVVVCRRIVEVKNG